MQKSWYESKGVWGGVLVIVGGLYGYFMKDPALANTIIIGGLGLWGIGIRAAQE